MTRVVRPVHASPRAPFGPIAKALVVCTVLLVGCGSGPKKQAAAPEGYDWSDYKGTFAPGGDQKTDVDPAKPAKSAATKESKPSKPPKNTKDDLLGALSGGPVASTPSKSSKLSKGTIQGESISSVSVDAVAGASKTVLKSKVVSSNVVVGQEYEQLQVVMKGVALQIIRPAKTPDPSGPKVRSPKVRSTAMLKTESGWYDEAANVLVLVKAGKKASSQKALAAILTR